MGGDAELGDSDFLPAELEVKVVFMTKGRRWSCLPPLLWYSLVLCWLLHSASHWLDPDVKLTLNKLSSWALAAGWQIPTPTLTGRSFHFLLSAVLPRGLLPFLQSSKDNTQMTETTERHKVLSHARYSYINLHTLKMAWPKLRSYAAPYESHWLPEALA